MSDYSRLIEELSYRHRDWDDDDAKQCADALTAQAAEIERLTRERDALAAAINCEWSDKADDLTPQIEETHPFKVRDFQRWNHAQVLVSNRHSKGALIALVAYLLHARATAAEEKAEWLLKVLSSIERRATKSPTGTEADHARDLRHVLSIARTALREADRAAIAKVEGEP